MEDTRTSYATTGRAFAGSNCLGQINLWLCSLFDGERRTAKGVILFGDNLNDEVQTGRIRIVPDDGSAAFELAVERIRGGCATVTSCGTMPW